MKSWKQSVSEIFTAVLKGFIHSLSGGFLAVMTVTSVYQSPFVTLLVSLLLSPYLFFDLRSRWRRRDWTILLARAVLVILAGAFILGFIRLAVRTIDVKNIYSAVIFAAAVAILFPCLTVFYICLSFFPDSFIVKKYNELTSGAVKAGIFWPQRFSSRRPGPVSGGDNSPQPE